MSSETYFNAQQAAKATGVTKVTIRTYLDRGDLPNAEQVARGKVMVWKIPLSELVAAGLLDKVKAIADEQAIQDSAKNEAIRTAKLEVELRLPNELLARADQELENYRQRERQLLLSIETSQAQGRPSFSWFRRNA
jgi:DNA-binding transcriptional MerR regulator